MMMGAAVFGPATSVIPKSFSAPQAPPAVADGPADSVKKAQAAVASLDESGNVSAFCKTCSQRTYQDGSDDMGVSFKNGGRISPNVSASVVSGHEREHVSRESREAEENGGRAVSSVRLHTDKCPECGKTYVSGGVTETTVTTQRRTEGENLLGMLMDVYI